MFRQNRLITRFELAALLGILLSVMSANIAVFGRDCDQLRGEVVRLHILANSDSAADQQLKLAVRDRILEEAGLVFETPESQAEAKQTAIEQLPVIQAAAEAVLREHGQTLPVRAQLCRMYFDTREYGEYSLPAGIYDAVRVSLGEGAGRNWWCVMYPPICVPAALAPAADGTNALSDMPAMQSLEALGSEPMFKPKLAVVEIFEKAKSKIMQ